MTTAPFPASFSVLSDSALAREVLPAYGLGPDAQCVLHTVNVNDTYRVGAGGETFFLRVYRAGLRSPTDIAFELDMLDHLHRKLEGSAVDVAHPLPRVGGGWVTELPALEGTRYAALFTFAPGREPSYEKEPEAMSLRYGQAVAALHNALDDFTAPHARSGPDLEHLIDAPLRHIEPFLAHRKDDWAYLQSFAARVRQRICDQPADALEWGACHGDLQGYHHHEDAEGCITFFDFDFCGIGFRAYDLAVFPWCARLSNQQSVWWPPYLRGYRAARPVSALDEAAVPLFICARHIWHMGLHTASACDWGMGGLNDVYFDQRLGWLRDLEKDYLG